MSVLKGLEQKIPKSLPKKISGVVTSVQGPIVTAKMPRVALGDLCYITLRDGSEMPAQVVAFEENLIRLAPFDYVQGVSPGAPVHSIGSSPIITVSDRLIGSVVDALGMELDSVFERGPNDHFPSKRVSILSPPPNPLTRSPIDTPLPTGVKALDGLCTVGFGQRLGLFAGAGVGKSTLLGMISRNAEVDISVIALVGERGRELTEFLHESLGEEGRKKAVVVVSTSDESPARRQLAAHTATAIAEYFRDQGKRVLLLVDSLTRTARAIREVGLAAGEIPVRGGYTSSVYTELPRLLERAGNNDRGSITAIYTVLTTSGVDIDPLGEEIKSIVDGHIYLDPDIAARGILPAIDLTISVSRLLNALCTRGELEDVTAVRAALARLKKDKDLLLFGGTPDEELGRYLAIEPELRTFLCQTPAECISMSETRWILKALKEKLLRKP